MEAVMNHHTEPPRKNPHFIISSICSRAFRTALWRLDTRPSMNTPKKKEINLIWREKVPLCLFQKVWPTAFSQTVMGPGKQKKKEPCAPDEDAFLSGGGDL
ncbi:hypothetical protein AVEN_192619-1 [Araneus ventricosus]|uniref:Uncharacterized protein n=1 Tax=Araneus ventricosus TaxID=182803 RepID=A0A4Y2UM82_ARAVE|nr:hypothetical protein AVEN_192619-1 [Araneus ventricosus]